VSPFDPVCFLILSAGIFAGAVVSGLVGFAFSAVAGAVLLHVLPPAEAVPLMMACSLVPQAVSLVALRGTVKWRGNPVLIVAGALGILPALYLLQRIDAHTFRIGFGLFLAAYATYMLLRPAIAFARKTPGRLHDIAVGFGGGLIGGLTAMPGALPTIWCDLRGMPKNLQRGQVQPFIVAMQVCALALMFSNDGLRAMPVAYLTVVLPALLAGTALGIVLFGKLNDARFRHVVLGVLLVAGFSLVM
jgi:uncharacterized membrane protein YfcA